MRLFEITLAIILTLRLLLPLILENKWGDYLSLIGIGVIFIHIGVEGYRWQMVPMYAFSLLVGFYSIYRLKTGTTSTRTSLNISILRSIAAFCLLALLFIPPLLLPVPSTPAPTGPYQVGTITRMLVDEDRVELYSDKPDQPRRLMVQFWYPTSTENELKLASWMDDIGVMGPAISGYLGLPSFFLDHLEFSKSHAYDGALVSNAEKDYPVLLFSHGWNGFRAQNTYQFEELASHGYIVIAPDHTYGAVATVFPDGEIAHNNPKALPTGMGLPDQEFKYAANLLGEQWAADLDFILETMSKPDNSNALDLLSNHIDIDRIGVIGHSTGGGAAIQFCGYDSRCKAILVMDPYMDPVSKDLLETGVSTPLLSMFSEVWTNRREKNNRQFSMLLSNTTDPIFTFSIIGTAHYDFSDLPALSPLAHALDLKGEIDGSRALRLINDFSLAYFNYYLKGDSNILFEELSTDYPEVIWENQEY
jgi:predicted dienelactone hydrolase